MREERGPVRATWIQPLLLLLIAGISIWDGLRIIRTEHETVGATEAGGWMILIGVLLLVSTAAYWYWNAKGKAGGAPDWTTGENVHLVAIAFAILILVLLFKPEGLFGRVTVEKV